MNSTIILLLLLSPVALAGAPQQKAKHPAKRSAKPAAKHTTKRSAKAGPPEKKPPSPSPVAGSQISVVTKDGKRVAGQVVDISGGAIQIKSDAGQTAIPFESVASLSFAGPVPPPAQAPKSTRHPNFTRDVESVLTSFQEIEKGIEAGADYTDYGRQLAGLRRATERFINKYAASEDGVEARSAALLSAALTDFTWARTVWTLKLGRSASTTVGASDSPVVADALELYPDLRPQAGATGVTADKLIGGLWKKAVADVDLTRKVVSDQ